MKATDNPNKLFQQRCQQQIATVNLSRSLQQLRSTNNPTNWFQQIIPPPVATDKILCLFDSLIDWLVDWLMGWLIDWFLDWLIDCLFYWLIYCVIVWLANWLIEKLLFSPYHSPLPHKPLAHNVWSYRYFYGLHHHTSSYNTIIPCVR